MMTDVLGRNCTRRIAVFAAVFGLLVVVGAPVHAQQGGMPDASALMRAYEQAQAEAARRAEIESDRTGAALRLLEPWRARFRDGGAEVESLLTNASVDSLLAASKAESWDALRAAAFGRSALPALLGDSDQDLVFFPVAPCRLFDTRLAGGALTAGVVRTFGVNGAVGSPGNMTPQGGAASNCGIPVDPAAVVVTLTAVSPAGAGNFRAWASGDPVPLASALNYSPALPALANTTVIPVCMGCGTGLDIDMRADVSAAHAVGDVVGYFWFANGLPTVRRVEFDFANVLGTGAVATLGTVTFTPNRSGNLVVQATGYCNITRTGTEHGIGIGLSAAPASGDVSRTAYLRVMAGDAVGTHQRAWAVTDYVAVTAGVSATVTLRAQQFFGTAGQDEDCSGTMLVRQEFSAF
jgi:hypothetical protein